MLKMLKGRIKTSGLFQAVVTADQVSVAADNADFNSLALLFSIGAFAFDGSNKVALKVEHSDDNSTFTDCLASDLDASESGNTIVTIDTGPEGDQQYIAHYRGNKRYVRGKLDISGTVSFAAAIGALQGYPELMPPL